MVEDKTYSFAPEFAFVYSEEPVGGPFPGLRSPWYDRKCAEIGNRRGVAVELDINPSGSVTQFFSALTVRTLVGQYAKEPLWEGSLLYDRESARPERLYKPEGTGAPEDRLVKLWLFPTAEGKAPPGRYVAGVDPAEGTGATNSCLTIVNARTGEKVLEYATPRIEATELAVVAVALCRLFKDEDGQPCRLAWEDDGPGVRFGKKVMALGYRAVYFRESQYSLAVKKAGLTPGWYPSPTNKRMLLEDYRVALEGRQFINPSQRALEECLHYRWTVQGTIEHSGAIESDDPTEARVNHGDRVIADALAWLLCRRAGILSSRGQGKEAEAQPGSFAWRFALANQNDQVESY